MAVAAQPGRAAPRLGVASLRVSFSDADGLRVEHGTGGATLLHVPASGLVADDWSEIWETFRLIETRAAQR